MGEGGQHQSTVFEQKADARLHANEGCGRLADFAGAFCPHGRGLHVGSQSLGGKSELSQRRGHFARGPDAQRGDAKEQETCGHDQPHRPKPSDLPACDDEAQPTVVRQFDPDLGWFRLDPAR
jgi:hypothetical protein